jgi:hypothetical protein
LDDLSQQVLGYSVPKGGNIRTSNWQANLSNGQQEYAARDCYASLLIYEKAVDYEDTPFEQNVDSPLDSQLTSPSVTSPADITRSKILTRVLLDPFHALKRITDTLPKKHPFLHKFCLALSEAMFVFDEEDKANVEVYLLAVHGTTFQEYWTKNPDWILQRVRRKIPNPHDLSDRLSKVRDEFQKSGYKDEKGEKLLRKESLKEFNQLIEQHVMKGCLSDPEGISLYFVTGRDKV